jgi:Darcynin, domain of unknown function
MSPEEAEPPVTAFMLIKTTPEWLALTVQERVHAFTTQVVPAIEAKTSGVRSRFYDTEFYSARVGLVHRGRRSAWCLGERLDRA